jgi:hypothetical protein
VLGSYLVGSIDQLQLRARRLIGGIPRNLPREYAALDQACRAQINSIISDLTTLAEDSSDNEPGRQAIRLRSFRRLVADLDLLESTGVMALMRRHSDEGFLNRIVDRIRAEIRYPLAAPVVSSLSQQYFQIKSELNLMFVPLLEGDFLLHLPDLYHELAHPLLSVTNDPAIEPFQNAFYRSSERVIEHLAQLERSEDRRHGPKAYGLLLKRWVEAWIPFWLTEFFCDAFAATTVGPAYVWAHLHLVAKRGDDPFEIWDTARSHPPDEARMRIMLGCLEQCGSGDSAKQIRTHWCDFVREVGLKAQPEYYRCVPDDLLSAIALDAKAGVEGLGCRVAGPDTLDEIHHILNSAWKQFWLAPNSYVEWERSAIDRLRLSESYPRS